MSVRAVYRSEAHISCEPPYDISEYGPLPVASLWERWPAPVPHVLSPLHLQVLTVSHFLSDNDVWHFSSETLRDLDRALKDNYDEWWRGAPESYRVPEFIDAEPVAILAKYGQNIKICNPTTVHADRATWDDMIDFNNILRIHMAYAVHTQCVLYPPCTPYALVSLLASHSRHAPSAPGTQGYPGERLRPSRPLRHPRSSHPCVHDRRSQHPRAH